jgi:NAD(P)-binding Rossmann-like domain
MAPSATSPTAKFASEFGAPDLESLPDKYGWPRENARGYRITEQLSGTERPMRIVHLGCGAAGICLAKFLPETLRNVSFTCYDKNADIGGTWLENRYDDFIKPQTKTNETEMEYSQPFYLHISVGKR